MILPAYIIEDLLRREKERDKESVANELYIEMPATDEVPGPKPTDPNERGIVIIDYSL